MTERQFRTYFTRLTNSRNLHLRALERALIEKRRSETMYGSEQREAVAAVARAWYAVARRIDYRSIAMLRKALHTLLVDLPAKKRPDRQSKKSTAQLDADIEEMLVSAKELAKERNRPLPTAPSGITRSETTRRRGPLTRPILRRRGAT